MTTMLQAVREHADDIGSVTLEGGKLARIHVNQPVIAHNRKHDEHLPTITVKQGKGNWYAHEVTIHGPSQVIHAVRGGRKPLSCGARVWIETKAAVTVTVLSTEVCKKCGTPEVITTGLFSNLSPYSRLCKKCMGLA